MRTLLLICCGLLLLAIAKLPIGYYTFLRIVITIGASIVVVKEYKNDLNFWIISFSLVALLFNPIIPIHLHNKSIWIPINIIIAILFGIKSFTIKKHKEK